MIGYVTLGTNDLPRARQFYDAVMGELGVPRTRTTEKSISFGEFGGGGQLSITRPFDHEPASVGNGTMISLQARDAEHVRRVHAAALAAGGTDEGAPGPRGTTFYGAYARDPDGNKLCFYLFLDAQAEAG